MHTATACVFGVLAFVLAARAGAVRGYISHWTNLLQPCFIVLVVFIGVAFWQRAQAGAAFEWSHWLVLGAAIATTVFAFADVVRAYRNKDR